MLTLETRNTVFKEITNGIRYWMSIENSNCAASFIYMTSQLPLNDFERASLDRTIQIFDAIFPDSPYNSMSGQLTAAAIPERYKIDVEQSFSYVMLTLILNFVDATLYNEAITLLLASSDNWKELYSRVIAEIADGPNCENFCRWCATNSLLALDAKKTNLLDYGALAIMFDENGFEEIRDVNEMGN